MCIVDFFIFSLLIFRKEQIAEQREYKKKKAQKKVLRMKELEQEREEQKSKWQQFNNKAYSKNKKGQVSLFRCLSVIVGSTVVKSCRVLISNLILFFTTMVQYRISTNDCIEISQSRATIDTL